MKRFKRINSGRLFILVICIVLISFYSFLCAFGRDEGTLGFGWFQNFMADAFVVFRFPAHTIPWEWIGEDFYFSGLILNALIYAFIIEFILTFLKRKRAIS